MKNVEKQAKTVEEAIDLALKELKTTRDNVEVEVLEEGNRGILGFLSRAARVRVTVKEDHGKRAVEFLQGLVKLLNVNAGIRVEEHDDALKINIEGKRMGVIIGKHGSTLDAIQYLTNLVANKNMSNYRRIVLDAENYREKREEALEKLARSMAKKVKETKKSVTLRPMPPNERRIIHTALQNDSRVQTKSIGEEPNRRVVISIK
ncbi:RNA-binding cell elongation regulator Jag/EloR [Thermoanaerobacterium sp. DL9XJH110]|uniref:RNA-binding cell elongation regulator Jag/EloR n=1 Tax=Thermoanaerobacterium sp. DL9XJH110 TaxID=3386643 RepID=UPI003BB70BDE